MSLDIINNITIDTVDDHGHHLIGNNHIHDVIFYDTTASGMPSWVKDYNGVSNPIVNGDFSAATISGSGQWFDASTDVAAARRYIQLSKIPYAYEDDLIAKYGTLSASTTTSLGNANAVLGDYFLTNPTTTTTPPRNVFPTNFSTAPFTTAASYWATSSGNTNHGFVTVDFGASTPQYVSGFLIDFAHLTGTDDATEYIGNWIIESTMSGVGNVDSFYTTIATGSNPLNWVHPVWVETVPVLSRFLRLRFKNNGSATRTRLGKFMAFSADTTQSGTALFVKGTMGEGTLSATQTLQFRQTFDFTGISNLYFDFKEYITDSSFFTRFFVDSTEVGQQFDLGVTGASETEYRQISGYGVDVSSFTGSHTLEIRKSLNRSGDNAYRSLLFLKKVDVKPGWYTEAESDKRGRKSAFPSQAYVVSDEDGLSIVEYSTSRLWMRFDYGRHKMLEQRPRRIVPYGDKIFLATSRGLYVIDFTNNCCSRFDERGEFRRYGIEKRNTDGMFRGETDVSPERQIFGYNRFNASRTLPANFIYDLVVGSNSVIGTFAFIGTNRGAALIDLDGSSYYSADFRPVSNIELKGTSLWYSQGYGTDTVIRRTELIQDLAVSNFMPEKTYYQGNQIILDNFGNSAISGSWKIMHQDPGVSIFETNVLTISGNNTKGGHTGLIFNEDFANRSFTAKIKARIISFPPDARGAMRFGFANGYEDDGIYGLTTAVGGVANRQGFFFSAFNTNPYIGRVICDSPFNSLRIDDNRGWLAYNSYLSQNAISCIGVVPTTSGTFIRVDAATDATGTQEALKRVATSFSTERRDFTAKIDVKIEAGATSVSSTDSANTSYFFGLADRPEVIPAASGTGQHINMAMVLFGTTTFSGGSYFYTNARYSGSTITATKTGGLPLMGVSENSASAPFREWRIDYDQALNQITGYIDGQLVNSVDEANQATAHTGFSGLAFGLSSRRANSDVRIAGYRNFRITYPTLYSGSRYKYGAEIIEDDAPNAAMMFYPNYGGLSRASNTTPTTSALSSNGALSDGLFNAGTTMTTNTSVGIDFGVQQRIELLQIYDTRTGTSGWASLTNDKTVEVYTSNDNSTWTLYRTYNFTHLRRLNGVTRLPFAPAIVSRFIQLRSTLTASTYNTDGANNWVVSEIRAFKAQDKDFFSTDNSSSSSFHEWKLVYDANIRNIRTYVDDMLVSTAVVPYDMNYGNIVLSHSQFPVNGGNNLFHAEFKDFELTFDDTLRLPVGKITDFQTNLNNSINQLNNYTAAITSASGVAVSDFEDPDYINRFSSNTTSWSTYAFIGATASGTWGISNGSLRQTSSSAWKTGVAASGIQPFGTHFVYTGATDPLALRTKDFRVLLKPVDDGSIGFSWCRVDDNNFYYFCSSSEHKAMEVGKVVSGIKTVIATTSSEKTYLPPDRWNEVKLDNTSSNQFNILVGGKTYITVSGESTFTSGRVALISNDNVNGRYADVGVISTNALPDQTRLFSHEFSIYGDVNNAITVFAEPVASRGKGLVFVGTNEFDNSAYISQINRPYWFDFYPESSDVDIDFEYGTRIGLTYHYNYNKFYMLFDKLSYMMVEVDLESKKWSFLPIYGFRAALGAGTSDMVPGGFPQLLFAPYTNEVICFSSLDNGNDGFWSFRTTTNTTTYHSSDPEQLATSTRGSYCIAYSLHNHKLIFGSDYIRVFDFPSNTFPSAPQAWASNGKRWGKSNTVQLTSWTTAGVMASIYCDFDKCVYIISGDNSTRTVDGTLSGSFYKYDVDRNSIIALTAPEFQVGKSWATRLVYDPIRLRIYAISQWYLKTEVYYWDIILSVWVRSNEYAPYTGRRNYPENNLDQLSAGDNFAAGTVNFCAYNYKKDNILMLGRGRDNLIYEYYPEKEVNPVGFNYKPAVDGLPLAAGTKKHFTRNSITAGLNYSSRTEFDYDYYEFSSEATPRMKLDVASSNHLTLSGTGPITFADSVQQYFTAELLEPNNSYEIYGEVALPRFTTDIFGTGTAPFSYFTFGLSDGLFPFNNGSTTFGSESPTRYQNIEIRVGVSGTVSAPSTHGPFSAHLVYLDGENGTISTSTENRVYETYTAYNTASDVDISGPFANFKQFRLIYEYETDTVRGYIDGQPVGSTVLRRKFDSAGVRFGFGWRICSDNDVANGHFWEAQLKNLTIKPWATHSISSNRLLTTITGSVGQYRHERWDSTIISGTSWAAYSEVYLPTSVKYTGFDYIATLAGFGDGYKLIELDAYYDGATKKIGLVGEKDRRAASSYLGGISHQWDDIDLGKYKIVRDLDLNKVLVYLGSSTTPSIEVSYDSLPSYSYQHAFYGKVGYGDWEKVFSTATFSGTWTAAPDYSAIAPDPSPGKRAFNGTTAQFATVAQGATAKAIYNLTSGLGTVDLYVFYVAEGFDHAKNTPYTIFSDGVTATPSSGGEGATIVSVSNNTDDFGNSYPNATTIRVDQRRKNDGVPTGRNVKFESSGWVYLGTYLNPFRVVITANAQVGTTSTQGVVCANAIGIDIGKYGRSQATLSTKQFRYFVGNRELPNETKKVPGLTVIDLESNERIDQFAEDTGPSIPDGNITSGDIVS